MAITCTNLTTGNSENFSTSTSTASISPTSGRVVLCTLTLYSNGDAPVDEPAIAGNGLTWTLQKNYATANQGWGQGIFIWAGTGTPSAGTITFTPFHSTANYALWVVDEVSSTDTTTPTIQQVGAGQASAQGTTEDITLAAFGSINNGTYGAFVTHTNASSPTAGTGFTLKGQVGSAGLSEKLTTIFAADNQTTVTLNDGSAAAWDGVGFELKLTVAVSAATNAGRAMTLMGVS